MKLRIYFIDVHHVSALHNNTGLMFGLNKCTLVEVLIFLEFHDYFNILNAACALPILFFTSVCVPPVCPLL